MLGDLWKCLEAEIVIARIEFKDYSGGLKKFLENFETFFNELEKL
jgi:hypothetical protein